MNRGKQPAKRSASSSRAKRSAKKRLKLTAPILLALLLAVFTIGGTAAYLITHTEPVVNKFEPSRVSCTVTEDFNGTVKSNVNVTNTGDIDAYLRVRLVSYRVNAEGKRIGGTAAIPAFTPGANWVADGAYYYYTLPVAPGEAPAAPLIGSITLAEYTAAGGSGTGRQVIEVVAEAIQSEPAKAVGEAWGVSISQGSVTAYPSGS